MCSECGATYGFTDIRQGFRCAKCGGVLDVRGFERVWSPAGSGISRYSSMLALTPVKSLGEGCTPLVAMEWRGLRIYLKLEHLNPSGSFKDRGTAIAISHAYRLGIDRVVEDTSGNTGISVAMYSRALGIRACIAMPRDAPEGKKLAIRLFGGEVIEASSRAEATAIAIDLTTKHGYYYIDHLSSPLYIEGYRTIAYEVFERIGVPDAMIVPAGSCGLLIGTYRGFEDLYRLGFARRLPRVVAVQGVEVAPLYEKVYGGKPGGGSSRIADGIRVPNPPRLAEAVDIVRSSGGRVVLVDDNEIVHALRELIDMGFVVEPTSATVYAALIKVVDDLKSLGVESVLLVLTGSGLKMLDKLYGLLTSSG